MQGTSPAPRRIPKKSSYVLCTAASTSLVHLQPARLTESTRVHKLPYQSIKEALRPAKLHPVTSRTITECHDLVHLKDIIVHDGAIRTIFTSLLSSLRWVAPDFQGTLDWSGRNRRHFITRHSQLLPQSPGASPRPCHLPLHSTGAIMIEMALMPLIATSLRYQHGNWPYLLSSLSQSRLH